MIYDAGKIIIGLILFLGLITFPLWYLVVNGKAVPAPALEIVIKVKHCVEPVTYMRVKHMDLLEEWRETVVREGVRKYIASDGKEYDMNLATCANCHKNREKFCDRCHDYVGVRPNCWNCHNLPSRSRQ